MSVTSGGGVKLSAYVGIHIVICGFRAFACAFCSAFKFTAFIKLLNFEFPSLGKKLFAENLVSSIGVSVLSAGSRRACR